MAAKNKNSVVAELPKTVDVSIRGASNALTIKVTTAGGKKGSLTIGSGSVAWWPEYNTVNAHRVTWSKLIEILEGMPAKRAAKSLTRSN